MRLRTAHGTYLRAGDTGIVNQTTNEGPWEEFTFEQAGAGRVAIKTAHDTYLRPWPDGHVDQAPWHRSWEKLTPDGRGFRSVHSTYLRAGDTGEVNQADRLGPWEEFTRVGSSPVVPYDPPWNGWRGDMLSLGDLPGGRTSYPTFWFSQQSRADRDQVRALGRERDHNIIMAACRMANDGHSWAPPGLARPFTLLEDRQATAAIEITKENAGEGFNTLWLLASDDDPGLHGVQSNPWEGRARLEQWLPWFLDSLVPHLTQPIVWPCLEFNEYAPALDQMLFFEWLHLRYPDLFLMAHYTAGRWAAHPLGTSGYGPASFVFNGQTITWEGDYWQAIQRACEDKVFLGCQTNEDGAALRHEMELLRDRSTGGHGWNAPFGVVLSELDWTKGERYAVEQQRIAASVFVTSHLHAAP